jgi:hypothetical protein
MYYGSTWKDYAVWQVSPLIAHELGCTNAVALELDHVSHGTPMALRVARDLLRAEDELLAGLVGEYVQRRESGRPPAVRDLLARAYRGEPPQAAGDAATTLEHVA